jgi:predicted anti-sigma-YlaC factor YlaD
MKCEELRRRLQPLLDGHLDQAEAAEARRHVDMCAACREELAALAHLDVILAAEPMATPPPHLRPAIVARARAQASRQRQLPPWLEVATFAGVMLTCAALAAAADLALGRPIALHSFLSPMGFLLFALGSAGFGSVYYSPHM